MSRRRIVITGLGGICSLGSNAGEIWDAMRAGRSGIGPLTIDRRDLKTNVGGEIGDIDASAIDERRRSTMSRSVWSWCRFGWRF